MRIFIAVDLPEETKNAIDKQITPLKKEYADFNWVEKENYHITLQFLGEIENVQEVIKKVTDVAYDAPSFYLYTSEAGMFFGNKLTLYVSFLKEKKLQDLEEKIASVLPMAQTGKFTPHMTIARAPVRSKQQYLLLKKKVDQLEIEAEFPVKQFYVYQSILSSGRPEYKKLAEIPLIEG